MEFFERAHVKTNTEKKDSKSDIVMKKQLKQMLHGYKKNDNKLIKTCIRCKSEACDSQNCFDDSSSVSGFSDLNLTNSSGEGDTSQVTFHSQFDSDFSMNKEGKTCKSKCKMNDAVRQSNSDSISEFSDDIESLSMDSQDETDGTLPKQLKRIDLSYSSDENLSSHFNITSDDSQMSISTSLSQTTLGSNKSESEEFDPEGTLASKILEKLGKKEKLLKNKKGRKRKLERSIKEEVFDLESTSDSIRSNTKAHSSETTPSQSGDEYEFNDYFSNLNKETTSQENDVTDISQQSTQDSTSTQSSPYISITAMNTPNESLSEVLGEYRYPTVRNLPCEKKNIVQSNSGIFSTEISIEDVEVDEEVSSLVPELDDDPTIQDFEVTTDDVSPEYIDEESTSVYDTVVSESTEKEYSQDTIDNLEQINPIYVYVHSDVCIFVLKHPGKLYLNGKVKVKALGGTVEVFGYTLKDEWCDLYAPNYSFAQCFRTIEIDNDSNGLLRKLTAIGLPLSDAEHIVSTTGHYDGVIAMCSLEDRKMDFVDNNFTVTDIFNKQSNDSESLKQATELLHCSLYLNQPHKVFETDPIWDSVVACGLGPHSRGIICGGKGTGKSTLLRYCVNKLLSNGPVLVIDVDPGQAEFTVAGNISATVVDKPLLGTNFTHLRKPNRMLNIGMINTLDKPSLYINAVNSLITYCKNQEEFKTMPWIVNTMGMCNYIGLKFITYTILLTNPTYLLQIDSKSAKKRFESDLDCESIARLYHMNFSYDQSFKNIELPMDLNYEFFVSTHLESLKNKFTLAAKDERYLNFLAYFGELLEIHSGLGLLDIIPYEVNLKNLNIISNVNIPVDSIVKVLNGKIVALCQLGGEKGKITNQDKPILCVGHGLIRGVDSEKGMLYVLTPTPVATLCTVDSIAYADWVPELRGQEKTLPAGLVVPYRTTSQYSQRQLLLTPRRRFNPIQLLKMSRST